MYSIFILNLSNFGAHSERQLLLGDRPESGREAQPVSHQDI